MVMSNKINLSVTNLDRICCIYFVVVVVVVLIIIIIIIIIIMKTFVDL